jgi:general secretion pathway protein D
MSITTRLACTALAATVATGSMTPAAWAQAASKTKAKAKAASTPIKGEGTVPSRAPVTLNFVNADVEAVTRAFAAMMGRQIIVDPRVRGNITVYSDQPLSIDQAYVNYLSALRGLGFAMVESGGLLKVVPEADARLQAGTVSVNAAPAKSGQVVTQIFTLRHENPNNLVPILRPLITANNTINVNPGTSALVITDYAENLQRIAKIIAALDQPSSTDFEIIPLQHAVASDIAPLVQRLADGGGGSAPTVAVPGAVGGATSVVADTRSNSLIVRAPNAAKLQGLRAAIARLDRPSQSGGGPGGNMWVVHLKNADATRLATVLRAAFNAGGSGGNTSSASPTTRTAAAAATAGNAAGASPQATAPLNPAGDVSTGGFVQADPATNSLIITGPEPLYRQVRAMIDQLDTRRAQIYIESLIVEVTGDNLADFGFQWQGISGRNGDSNIVAGGTSFGGASSNIIDLSVAAAGGRATAGAALQNLANGFNIGVLKNLGNGLYGLSAIARALQSQSNTNIMSTPNLITVDNEEAKIVVGKNVPFITGQFTSTGTGTTNPFQTVERKDVGITLRIKPQIGENGTIRLAIFQESSDIIGQADGTSGTGPTTSKRSIDSNVIVDDGAILVLGGLIEDRFEDSKSKVPLLGDIPFLGALFRSESRTRKRSNLMVFLKPTVMRTAEDSNNISLDRYDRIRTQQQNAQPTPNLLLPINESPVLPALQTPQGLPLTLPPMQPMLPMQPAAGAAGK